MRNNFVTCLENSPLSNKYMKPRALGINFISIMGYDISNVGNIDNSIIEMKKNTAAKVLGLLFKGKFNNTLTQVAVDNTYTEYIKNNLENMMELIASPQTSTLIGNILKMFVKYNKKLGDWVISKLLDFDINLNKLAYSILQHHMHLFIFKLCKKLAKETEPNQEKLAKLQPFFDTFND